MVAWKASREKSGLILGVGQWIVQFYFLAPREAGHGLVLLGQAHYSDEKFEYAD